MATTLLGVELDKILRIERDIVKTERDKVRVDNNLEALRKHQSKLIMQTFQDLEVKIRRYKRKIHELEQENKALKSVLGSDQF